MVINFKNRITILLIWLAIGFLSSLQSYYYRNVDTPRFSFLETVVYDTSFYLLWAFLTPLALWLARTYRIEKKRLLRTAAVHLVAGLLIGFFHRGFFNFLFMYAERSDTHPFSWEKLFYQTLSGYDLSVMIYFAVVFISHTKEYYQRFHDQALQSARLQTELSRAQLDALRMQLQPHFLFNTLNAIAVLIEEEPKAARKTVNLLSDLLRMTLEQHQEREVPLSREMEFITRYLQIYEIRFGSRLTVDLRVDTDAAGAVVPCLILQPIVENALRHGIENIPGAGTIRIKALRDNGVLRLSVSDSGPGFGHPEAPNKKHPGVGLRNTRQRLEYHYGKQGRLDIADSELGGLEVVITVPFRLTGVTDV